MLRFNEIRLWWYHYPPSCSGLRRRPELPSERRLYLDHDWRLGADVNHEIRSSDSSWMWKSRSHLNVKGYLGQWSRQVGEMVMTLCHEKRDTSCVSQVRPWRHGLLMTWSNNLHPSVSAVCQLLDDIRTPGGHPWHDLTTHAGVSPNCPDSMSLQFSLCPSHRHMVYFSQERHQFMSVAVGPRPG